MIKQLFLLIVLTVITSCGGKSFTVNQVESHAYLIIKGKSAKETVIIDSSPGLVLGIDTKEYVLDDGISASKIQIKEGTHNLKIIRNNNVIIQRNFYVTSGNAFEVNI